MSTRRKTRRRAPCHSWRSASRCGRRVEAMATSNAVMRIVLLLIGALASAVVFAQAAPARTTGQTLYLPIYSHIWHGETDSARAPQRTLVSVAVSIRNTDPKLPIRVLSAQYY